MAATIEQISHAADFAEHKRTYHAVLRLVTIAVIHILSVLVALAIGGVSHGWHLAAFWIVAATAALAIGASSARLGWRPGGGVLVLALLSLAAAAG